MLLLFQRKSYTFDEDAKTCTEEPIPPDEYMPRFSAPDGAIYRHIDRYGSFIPNLGVTTDYFRMDTGITHDTMQYCRLYISIVIEDGGVFHGYYAPEFDSNIVCVPVIESYENIDTAPTHQRNRHVT